MERFEHYELVKGEDGKPVELGRGAMGITYTSLTFSPALLDVAFDEIDTQELPTGIAL